MNWLFSFYLELPYPLNVKISKAHSKVTGSHEILWFSKEYKPWTHASVSTGSKNWSTVAWYEV